MGDRLKVICVLRSGREYRIEHVAALAGEVRRHLSMPYRLVCLTNQVHKVGAVGIEAVRLPDDWPGWWSKICLFKPGLFEGPCFYLDLDTRIVAPIDDIVLGHRFTVLESFWSPERIGSGMMAWDTRKGDLSPLYDKFSWNPHDYMREYVTTEKWGDQGFIRFNSPVEPERWQMKFPGKVVSYKRTCIPAGRIPEGAAVVCFHGKPRPWEIPTHHKAWFDVG